LTVSNSAARSLADVDRAIDRRQVADRAQAVDADAAVHLVDVFRRTERTAENAASAITVNALVRLLPVEMFMLLGCADGPGVAKP
jgi:predicted CoA-binding protein